jgi:hypothetical protein
MIIATETHAPSNETTSLVSRYIAVWSEPDAERRRRAITDLWVNEGIEYVEAMQFRGHEQLETRLAEAYSTFVENGAYLVAAADDLAVHGDVLTFTIELIDNAEEDPGEIAWAARVFLIVDNDGKIVEDYHLTVKPLPA